MSFHNQYVLDSVKNQLLPQQLTNNVFFGPLNALSQRSFLERHNIRFFIAVGFPTHRVAQYCQNLAANDCIVVNFDWEFCPPAAALPLDPVTQYCSSHSNSLQQLIMNVATEITTSTPVDSNLTPQPELDQMLYHSTAHYACNVIAAQGLAKYQSFQDVLTLFKLSGAGNVLVFSSNGNDQELGYLLISHILSTSPTISLFEAAQYLKSLRPTMTQFQTEPLFWCQGIIEYAERLKTGNFAYKALDSDIYANDSSTSLDSSAKRRNSASSDYEQEFTCAQTAPSSTTGTPKSRKIASHIPK